MNEYEWPEVENDDPREQLEAALDLCGCTDADQLLVIVRDLLNAIATARERDEYPVCRQILQFETNPAFYYVTMNWLDLIKLIEHGIAIRGSWLTIKGKAVRERLNKLFPPQEGGNNA